MNIPSPFFQFVKSSANDSRTSKLWNKNLVFALPLNADIEKDPERLKIEFINFQCYSNCTRNSLKEIGKTLIPAYQKKRFLCSDTWSQE
jgi:hypothetical protein